MTDKKNNQTNALIKALVIAIDFVLLNITLLILHREHPNMISMSNDEVKVLWVASNLGMILAQLQFSTIIHMRWPSIGDVFKRMLGLTIAHVSITFVILKMIYFGHPVFWLIFQTGVVEVIYMFVVRIIELYSIKWFRQTGRNSRTATFIGSDPELKYLYFNMIKNPTLGYRLKGYYSDTKIDEEQWRAEDEDDLIGIRKRKKKEENTIDDDLKWLGSLKGLMTSIDQGETPDLGDDTFICLPISNVKAVHRLSDYCDQHITRLFYIPSTIERLNLRLRSVNYGRLDFFTTNFMTLQSPVNRAIKRLFDIFFSFLALICTLPLYPFIALIIRIQSPGPIFFKQERTGAKDKSFTCYKFRSMHVNDEADTKQATEDDPREFPFGRFMRKYNIDELPQFWNALIGDMSIVGPRPHMIYHTEKYKKLIGQYMLRLYFKPGITGWAQVNGLRGETKELEKMKERVKYDIWYFEHWNVWLDLRIMWMTVKDMLYSAKKAVFK